MFTTVIDTVSYSRGLFGLKRDPARIEAVLTAQTDYDWIANGRFKGGHITRHYGAPADGIDAVQLELSQRTYMDEDSFAYDDVRASRLQPLLRALLQATLAS